MPNSFASEAIKGVSWTLIEKTVVQTLAVITLILLARFLEPTDFGLIGLLILFFALSNVIVTSGLGSALIQKNDVTTEDYSTVFYLNIAIAATLYAGLYFLAPCLANYFNEEQLVYIARVYFVVILFNSLTIVPIAKFKIELNFQIVSKIEVLATLLASVAAILAAAYGANAWSLVIQSITQSFVRALLLLYCAGGIVPSLTFTKRAFYRLFGFGSRLLVTGISSTTANNLHQVMIGKHYSISDVGHYTQSIQATNAISGIVTNIVNVVALPILSKIKTDKARLNDTYQQAFSLTALITFPLMFGFAAIADSFVHIFLSEKWAPTIPILKTLSVAASLIPIGAINLSMLAASGRADLYLRTEIAKLPVSIILLIAAIPYGTLAIACSVLLSRMTGFCINAYYPGRLYDFGFLRQLKQIFPTILAASIMYITVSLIELPHETKYLLVRIGIGITTFAFSAYILKAPGIGKIYDILRRKLIL